MRKRISARVLVRVVRIFWPSLSAMSRSDMPSRFNPHHAITIHDPARTAKRLALGASMECRDSTEPSGGGATAALVRLTLSLLPDDTTAPDKNSVRLVAALVPRMASVTCGAISGRLPAVGSSPFSALQFRQ
jgi:hypothetical protein